MQLRSLKGANIYVSFDLVFPPDLMAHMCELFNNSKDTLLFVSTKKDLPEKYCLQAFEVYRESVSFSGSNSRCTMYFYQSTKRRGPQFVESDIHPNERWRLCKTCINEQQTELLHMIACARLPEEIRTNVQKEIASVALRKTSRHTEGS